MIRLSRQVVQPFIRQALREDGAFRDVTSVAVIPVTERVAARIVAKESGVLAGAPIAVWAFQMVDFSLRCAVRYREGTSLRKGQTILTVEGRARSVFAAERTALNFLGHLSGVAMLTAEYVHEARGTHAKIFDTRKTLPGLRLLEKYAVRVGGGHNHRMGLDDAVLIKTNHLRALARPPSTVHGPQMIHEAVEHARQVTPKRFIEVEVTDLDEFMAALYTRPNAILLDNWGLADIRRAVQMRNSAPRTLHPRLPRLEVSGGVTLANVRAIAKTGVDRISIGRLTHSAPALDVSLAVMSP